MCLVSKGLVECGFKTDLLDLPCELQIETPYIRKSREIDDIDIVILDMDTGHHTRVMLSCFDVLFGLRLEVLSSSFLIELAKTVCSNHMTKRFSNRFLHEQPRLLTTGRCSPLTFSHFHVSGSQHANLALVSILFEEVNVFSVKQDAHTCRRSISAEPSMLQCFEMLLEHFCAGDNVHGSPDDCLYSFVATEVPDHIGAERVMKHLVRALCKEKPRTFDDFLDVVYKTIEHQRRKQTKHLERQTR